MINLFAFISGIIFALGLCISQMVNPQVVINFLDVTGDWDPRLLFVMAGALLVTAPLFHFIKRFRKPVCDTQFHLPTKQTIDRPLVMGAVLFGIGWGLSGICPGPAVTALAFGIPSAFVFFAAMLMGMLVFQILNTKADKTR